MHPLSLVLCTAALAHETAIPVSDPSEDAVRDIASVVGAAAVLHGTNLAVRGRVAWAGCEAETCYAQLLPPGGGSAGILVRSHAGPSDGWEAGHDVIVEGRFFVKIYPGYRMAEWQRLGWRSGEVLPAAAEVLRLDATRIEVLDTAVGPVPRQASLDPWVAPTFDLAATEFEANGMATGRTCLAPGEEGPRHGTGRFQELIVGLEGELDVDAEGQEPRRVGVGRGTWIAPLTLHAVANRSAARACYLFVTASPSGR